MKDTYIKLAIGTVLFATWVGLVVFKVPGTDDLIKGIGLALAGLGFYHLSKNGDAGTPTDKDGGFAKLSFLSVTATMGLSLMVALSTTGCATTQDQTVSPVAYVQACSTYGVALQTAVQLRQEGAVNQTQIDQITLIDSQVTPLCTGTMPTDSAAFTQKVAAAVTTLTILELARKEK